ncbi:DNA replication domain protein [Klebsiella variicola]|uniref:DNA replication domain protein n=1 Tax=Klebsiella variicola TaxID=244366 RepID=UPI0006697223|nr:DNA replication domain protein [Klebsiella variicola]EKV6276362.1 DNA replication domain protein [Klebsiella pneumoniae]HBZ7662829.1 DNA replication domain protein [Klebsiella variicola subsp. variicola]HBV9689141.1 DNA replication domain protein [Klebsiella variicola]HBX9953370.1 DNA replication domain protein [Klebsiella variicola]HCB1356624.1 DNA replication domain protein [Klebsiella variicola subsp. variicola]
MASSWIKVEVITPDKPEIFQIAEILNIDPDAVLGKLVRIWAWADQQTVDGNAGSVTKGVLDRIAFITGFADALIAVGWLAYDGNKLILPNFERHNGESSKKRALTNRRVAAHRKNETQKVTLAALQKSLPEEEEEEEEEVKDKIPPNPPRGREQKKSYPYPEQLNAEAWDEWKAYRSEMRFKAYAPTERSEGAAITELINLSGGNHTRQMQIVKQSMAKGWKGLFELKGGSGQRDVNTISRPDTEIPPGFRGGPAP